VEVWNRILEAIAGRQRGAIPPPTGSQDPAPAHAPQWWEPHHGPFTQVVAASPPAVSLGNRALRNTLAAQLCARHVTIPEIPSESLRAWESMREPGYDRVAVAYAIASDARFAATVIEMAHRSDSAGRAVSDVITAAGSLGIATLRTLLLMQILQRVTLGDEEPPSELAKTIWQRAVGSAMIARGLARFTGLEADWAFQIGLWHDAGTIVLLRELEQRRQIVRYAIDVDHFSYLCHDAHEQIGRRLAQAWSLPPPLEVLIADHHRYPARRETLRTERLVLQLADTIRALLGLAPPAFQPLTQSPALAELGLDPAQNESFAAWLTELPAELERTLGAG
jgi:HD-like signal output (HDOD) protein